MDFVIDNYLWFIIGAIVILMIIVGYFAEKTDFGRKPLRKKDKKEETKDIENVDVPVQENKVEVENKGINDILAETADLTESSDLTGTDMEVNEMETQPLEPMIGVELPEESLTENPDLIGTIENVKETESAADVELPEEDLTVPFGDVEINVEDNVPEVVEDEQNSDEDEVWKF